MTSERGAASESIAFDQPFFDDSGRPIGEYEPSSLQRLAHLHGESVETARLANLLGRTPGAGAALIVGNLVLVGLVAGTAPSFMLGLWTVFIVSAAVWMGYIWRRSIGSAFELTVLKRFVLDLHAVLLYAGFAWGAGVFLGVPWGTGADGLVFHAIGGAAVMGMILRARTATIYFLAPATILPALAALTGPAGMGTAALIVGFALVLALIAEGAERWTARRLSIPSLPVLRPS